VVDEVVDEVVEEREMWLPILLLALMASGSACPDLCQCRAPLVECQGRAPELTQLDELPPSFTELKIRDAAQEELRPYIGGMPNSSFLQRLRAVEVSNCSSLTDQRYLRWDLDSPVLPNLRSLNVSHNKLKSIHEPCALLKGSLDSRLRVLDAGHNQIDSLAINYCRHMFQLTWLSLAGNNLYFVSPGNLRHLKSLEYLDLSDNVLQSLDKIFDPLASLQRLNVAGNKLEHVQANWFQNLGKLYELDVSRNKLTFVSADALRPLSSLSVIKLAENPLIERDLSLLLCTGRRLETVDASRLGLVRIPAALTRSVKVLKLAGNQLTSIYSGDLDSYPLLKSLDLSDNRLTIIEDDALGRLDSLEELILSGNILLAVPKSLPSGLLKLDLRQNAVSKLKANDLQGIYVLKELLLSGNVISSIEEGSFRQMPALQVLDISDNPIRMLPADTLSGPTNLMTLRMSGLMWLEAVANQNQDTAFPFLTPERLVTVDISRSPTLCAQLLADNAALSACKSLQALDLSYTNISSMRSDLGYVLPQLRKLNLIGNEWNCSEDQYWLGQWIRQHKSSINYSTRCIAPRELEGKLLEEMPNLPSSETTATIPRVQQGISTPDTSDVKRATLVTQASTQLDSNELTSESKALRLPASMPKAPTTLLRYTNTTKHLLLSSTLRTTAFSPSFHLATQSILTTESQRDFNSQDLQSDEMGKDNELSWPSSLKFDPRKLTTSMDDDWSEDYPTVTEKYPTDIARYASPGILKDLGNATQLDLTGSGRRGEKSALATSTAHALTATNETKNLTDDIATVTPIPEENKRARNGPTVITTTSTRAAIPSSAKASYAKIKGIMMNGYKDVKKDVSIFNKKSVNAISEFSRSKLLIANEEPRINEQPNLTATQAEKFNSQATESGARTSESITNGTHPGMLVLLGAAIGAAAALTVVLSRRATVKRRDRKYHRHENIEVHALTPTTELW
jgi:Leucine-rich repeat (LRR) protein